MDTNQGYKNRALKNLEGNWADAAILTLVYMVIAGGPNFFVNPYSTTGSVVSLLWLILCIPLMWGFVTSFLSFIRGEEKLTVANLIEPYKGSDLRRIVTTYLLVFVYTFLWSLLLIVPGIIKGLSYSLTPFVLKDNPELSDNAAIEKSMRLMDGHKMDLFLLILSFIGWAILSLFTLGLGFILLIPYMVTSITHFYEDLKKEKELAGFEKL